MWYLMSFYVTWVPYLALQYSWAAGVGYSQYGFVLFACTLVPLQGFWNSAVFFRIRAKKRVTEVVSEVKSRSSSLIASRLSRLSSLQRSSQMTPNAGDGSLFDSQFEKTKSAVRFSDIALGGINEGDGKDPEEMGVADTALGGINEDDGKAPEEMGDADTALGGINQGDGKAPEEMGDADTALGGINEGDGKDPEEMGVA